MLSEKLIDYLTENADKTLPEFRDKYLSNLKNLGFDLERNASFIEFMTNYSDEYYGAEGLLNDVMQNDLSDFENGLTKHLITNYNLPAKYISLFNLEVDDYLLYNKENDSVIYIDAKNIKELSNENYYDKKWATFNDFLEHFFEIN